jgi:hypothetical protein
MDKLFLHKTDLFLDVLLVCNFTIKEWLIYVV